MRSSRIVAGLAAGLVILLAGCGGDEALVGVNSGDELSDVEIQDLFNQLGTTIGGIGDPTPHVVAAQEGPTRAPAGTINIDQSVSETVACEAGNIGVSGKVEGSVDDETFESDLALQITMNFNGCAVSSETNTITLSNPPGLRYDLDFLMGQTSFSTSGTQTGGFNFVTSDGRQGSCAIDLDFDVSYDMDGGNYSSTVTGEVCGRSAAGFEPYTGT